MKNKQKARPQRRPMSVQQLTGGPGPTVEAIGKRWRLGFNDQDAKGALEELIRAHHARRAIRDKRNIGGDEGQAVWDEFSGLSARGFYDTFGPGWLATLKSSDGVIIFLQSLLFKHHPEVTAAETQQIFAAEPELVMAAVEVVAPDFFAAVAVQKGYSTDEAKSAAPQIADAMREQIAAHKAAMQGPHLPEKTPEPATSPT